MDQTHAWHNQSDEKCFLQGENFIWYFSNCFLHVSLQTFISPDNMPQSLCALSISFPLLFSTGTFIYFVVITLDQIIPEKHLHGFISDGLVVYMREGEPSLQQWSQSFISLDLVNHSSGEKKKRKKGCYFNFLFPRQNYIFSTNSSPHCPLHLPIFSWQYAWKTLTQLFTQVKALVHKSFTEGQEMHGARTAGLHHDFRIHQHLSHLWEACNALPRSSCTTDIFTLQHTPSSAPLWAWWVSAPHQDVVQEQATVMWDLCTAPSFLPWARM